MTMKRLIAKIAEEDKVREFPRKIKPTSYKFDLGYRTVFLNIDPDYVDNVMSFEFKLEDKDSNTVDKILITMSQDEDKPFTIEQGKDIILPAEHWSKESQ